MPVISTFSATLPSTGFFLLLGESGSGKTTFLNLLAGFLNPDSGEVVLNDQIIAAGESIPPGEIDYITQDIYFIDYLRVEDNLRLVGASEEVIYDITKRFGIFDKLRDYPTTLSGGERARLALIRTLIMGKKILLLDEPTASLDETNKRQVFEALAAISSQVLVVCASHDPEAICYADHVIRFSKNDPTPIVEEDNALNRKIKHNPVLIPTKEEENLPPPGPFLKKWFHSGRREKHAKKLFFVFLVLSYLFLFFADTPAHKLKATCQKLFMINSVKLTMTEGIMLNDLDLDLTDVREIVIDYRDSCPYEGQAPGVNPNQMMRYDRSFVVLPENIKHFHLPDPFLAGHYFTASTQLILSYEKAKQLSPDAPEKLIGTNITSMLFPNKTKTLTVVGVFREMSKTELAYLNACGADYDLMNFNPNNYSDVYFINSALVSDLLESKDFFRDNGHRSYNLYFDSYSEATRFLKIHRDLFSSNKQLLANVIMPVDLPFRTDAHSRLMLPLAILVFLFTVLFYSELDNTEFLYNHDFVAVFEYSGYPKKQIMGLLIRSAIGEYLRLLFFSFACSCLIAVVGNILNHHISWFVFELFSIEPWVMVLWFIVSILLSVVLLTRCFHKVQVFSWYENLINTRDVL